METQIPIDEVIYDDATRQRKDLDSANESSIDELAESLRTVGQINAIVVSRDHRLLAGRRRLEAARRLGWTQIRVTFWEELTLLDQKIIEYDENVRRKQLTWQEAASAIKEIHDLKIAREGPRWSRSDTARALGLSVGKVSEDLDLASALTNTRVARRPTRRGAINTVKRERELTIVRELARRRAVNLGIGQDLRAESFTSGIIYNMDCREVLRETSECSVDLIIIDPPWGIDFDSASQWTGKWIASYDDSPSATRTLLSEVFPLLFRVLKPTCHIYCFFPIQDIQWWIDQLTRTGFNIRQRPLIWYKSGQPGISDVYSSFLPSYESILWGFKGGDGGLKRLFSHPLPEAQSWPRLKS